MLGLLALMLALPGVIAQPLLEVDLAGAGVAEAVSLELGEVQSGCARAVWLRVGERRVRLAEGDGLWVGDSPPKVPRIEVVDLTPKTPDRMVRVSDFVFCDRDYGNHFDLVHGQHTAWLVGLKGDALAVLWTATTHDARWRVHPDGSWRVREYVCVRPAKRRGDWDDAGSVVLAWGVEAQIVRRFRWTEAGVESQVVSRRRVRSGCGGSRG